MAKNGQLTPKRERFCVEYNVDFNASAAARRAGFKEKSAAVMGHELLRIPKVQARIMEIREESAKKYNITKESLMQILRDIAGAKLDDIMDDQGQVLPPDQWPDHMKRAVSGMEVDEIYSGTGENRVAVGLKRKIRLSEKTKAIELLNKMLGFNAPERVAPVDANTGEALIPVINIITKTN